MPRPKRRRYCYDYPRPAVTVDVVILTVKDGELQALLIRRGREPFKDCWAIPGGFVEMDETLEQGARRELEEETGVKDVYLEQLATFGDPGRDPRGRVITVAYVALVKAASLRPRAADDAAETRWFSLDALPELAFDHRRILACARQRLRAKLPCTTAAAHLLPRTFTLEQLQHVGETILSKPIHRSRFRRDLLRQGLLVAVKTSKARAPASYRFTRAAR